MHPLTVAAVQAEAVPGDVAANAATAARLVRSAGARVVVFPELFLCAYHPPTLRSAAAAWVAADARRIVADLRLAPLVGAARAAGAVVVVGAAVRHADGRPGCAALVVDRSGVVHAAYDKQHLSGAEEQELFVPGDRGTVLEVDGWRLGLSVCYDGAVPEHAAAAARAGAHGYLCATAYFAGAEHRRDVRYPARALDNALYVVFANAVGGAAPYACVGGAAVYDPAGRLLDRGPAAGESVVTAVLDPARTRPAGSMPVDGPGASAEPPRTLTG